MKSDGNKNGESARFPNVAGFARRLGIGIPMLTKVQTKYPEQYGALMALFEDEALNYVKSSTVLNTYIKERLDLGEKKEGDGTSEESGICVVFEHDMSRDGA